MSRRTTFWRKRGVIGKEPFETAQNILERQNKGSAQARRGLRPTELFLVPCEPMRDEKALRLAATLHRPKR